MCVCVSVTGACACAYSPSWSASAQRVRKPRPVAATAPRAPRWRATRPVAATAPRAPRWRATKFAGALHLQVAHVRASACASHFYTQSTSLLGMRAVQAGVHSGSARPVLARPARAHAVWRARCARTAGRWEQEPIPHVASIPQTDICARPPREAPCQRRSSNPGQARRSPPAAQARHSPPTHSPPNHAQPTAPAGPCLHLWRSNIGSLSPGPMVLRDATRPQNPMRVIPRWLHVHCGI